MILKKTFNLLLSNNKYSSNITTAFHNNLIYHSQYQTFIQILQDSPNFKEEKRRDMADNTIQDPLKPWKYLISPHLKPTSLNPTFMKGLLVIFIFTGFSLCYFSIFPGLKLHLDCPECYRNFLRVSYHLRVNDTHDEKTDLSHILFGIGGSAETWSRRRRYCELWWKPNVTRGYVWLDKDPGNDTEPWSDKSPPYRVSSNTTRFSYINPFGSRSAIRIARIVKESFELGLENVRWFVMGDDDTVFFTENLLHVLNKYDHKEMYYIGGSSESVEQALFHSYTMGYGGAGFAISYPLAKELVRILDGCIDRYAEVYGSDQKIGSCMAEIGVPITKELGFHQMDIRGSPYGLLSAHPLAPLVSLHHLDYLQALFPNTNRVKSVKKLINAYESDPSRVLQHTFCYDFTRNWTISISWGYAVQLYPFLLTGKELSIPLQTFLTWGSWSTGPFTFNTRIMSLDPCERPLIYYFDGVEKLRDIESTLTWYKKSKVHRKQCDKENYVAVNLVKGFNVSAPVFDPQLWNKPPRRQCCEVTAGSDQQNGVIDLRIRGCNRWESVTPR